MSKIKLSTWAKNNGYSYRGAYENFLKGRIPGAIQLASGRILVEELEEKLSKTVVYARVSSTKQKGDLSSQANRIEQFCAANGWVVDKTYKEIASGLNDSRPMLEKILLDESITRIVVEHKDRLTRFGFNYIEKLSSAEIVVINKNEDKDDLIQDLISVITSMVARYYGQRRGARKTEAIIKELTETNIAAYNEEDTNINNT